MSNNIKYPDIEVFEEEPIDEFIENNLSKLPDDLTPEIKRKLLNDAKFLADFGFKSYMPKKAYPNYDAFTAIKPQRDLNKWMDALRKIYYNIHQGLSHSEAVNGVINNWDKLEQLDFNHWMKYYTENGHLKYKKAQLSFLNNFDRIGYPLEIDNNNIVDLQSSKTHPDVIVEEKRQIIEKQRNKIISRLDSAEKLLRSYEGHLFAGNEIDILLDIIYQLKKKIHTINKRASSVKLYEDLIIREANILNKKGFTQASKYLYKLAQEAPNPLQNVGNPGTLPLESPNMANSNPSLENLSLNQNKDNISPGMSDFLKNLNNGIDVFDDENNLEIYDDDNNLEIYDDELYTTAQVVESEEKPAQPLQNVNNENKSNNKNFDAMMDNALSNLTIEDVINKLEDIATIYRVRELPRQLAMVDMMLDRLNLSSLFPSLSEALNKSLDSNNYVSSRLEEILVKLRGTLKANPIDLAGTNTPPSSDPKTNAIKQNLELQDQQEKARKEKRKQMADQALDEANKPTPQVDMQQDLANKAPQPEVAKPTV